MAVVKADAYGHGVDIVAPILAANGVLHWGIATVDEGRRLRAILSPPADGDEHEIYVMTAVLAEHAADVVALNLTPYCSDLALASAMSRAAVAAGVTATLHVEVDTGIGRAGVQPGDVPDFVAAVRKLPGVAITGICTHFTAADTLAGPEDPLRQHALFESVLAKLDPAWLSTLTVHAANSPGILRVADARHQLIRPGLLIYGIGPSAPLEAGDETPFPYKPVMALKARAVLVRRLPAGAEISYSRTYRLPADATIATIAIGYGDGFPRRLSNIGYALLPDGTKVPMRGRVCMDQVCVEVPDGVDLDAGDTVTLVGSAGGSSITALEVADLIEATPHEIPTCLTARVPRILI